MNDLAILKLQVYKDKYLTAPVNSWDNYHFTMRSYARWAADEIIDRLILQEPCLPGDTLFRDVQTPKEILIAFIDEMSCFSAKRDGDKSAFIFISAKEAAMDMLDYLEGVHYE